MKKKLLFCDDALRTLLKKDDYVNQQLLEARNKMCDRNVTEEQWQDIRKIVGLIFFYSSEKLKIFAESILLEMTMREPYMWKLWGNEE